MLRFPETGSQAFEVAIYNQDVRALVKANRSHCHFDDRWADVKLHDVIARDEGEARALIAVRFPPEDGFVIKGMYPLRPHRSTNTGQILVFLTLAHSSANMASAPARRRCPRPGALHLRLLVLAVMLAVFLSTVAVPQAHADIDDVLGTENHWDGTVEVSTTTLTITEGTSATYSVKLSHDPIYYRHVVGNNGTELVPCRQEDPSCEWWVLIQVGAGRNGTGKYDLDNDGQIDLTLIPSIGRKFDRSDYSQWKTIRIHAEEDDDTEDQTVTFSHEVWGDDTDCPIHDVGHVTVRIIDNDNTGNGGNGGNGENGGDGGNGENGENGGNGENGENGGNGENGENGGDPSLPTLSINDVSVEEGETAEFTVTLSEASEQTVTVNYRTDMGLGISTDDYQARSGELAFDPGDTTKTISVPTVDDGEDEETEAFTVKLSNSVGATLLDDVGVGKITDIDGNNDGDTGDRTNRDAMKRRVELTNRTILPEVGRAVAFDAVRCRVDQVFSGISGGGAQPDVSPSLSLALPPANPDAEEGGSLSLEQALSSASFLLPLMGEESGASGFAIWGCGNFRNLNGGGDGGTPDWDGDVSTMQIGIDARFGSDMLAGVALSRSQGSFVFGGAGVRGQPDGSYDLRLNGVHPYWGMALSQDTRVWASLGHARGSLEITDDLTRTTMKSDAELSSATMGINSRLLATDQTTLMLKGEWALAKLDVDGDGDAMREASADMQRLRLSTEAEYKYLIPYVGLLTPWGEVGLRHDGGDGETGASAEVGGGLRFRNIEQGWNTELFGRWRAAQGDLPEERGIAARFRYDPYTLGVGPWVSLSQSWGETASGVERVWQEDPVHPLPQNELAQRLDAEFGYGIRMFHGRGSLTFFGAMSLAGDDGRRYRMGSRLALGPSAQVSLEAERRDLPADETAHTVMMRIDARF